MRYLGILVLTCLPLATLTARSLFVSVDVAPSGDDVVDLKPPRELAEQRKKQVQSDESLVKDLPGLIAKRADGRLPDDTPRAGTESLNDVVGKLRQAQPAYDLLREVKDLRLVRSSWLDHKSRQERGEWREQAESQRTRIQGFLQANEETFRNVSGAQEVFDLFRHRVAELAAEIDVLDEYLRFLDLWSNADYRACVGVLDGISTDRIREPDIATRIQELVRSQKELAVFIADFFELVEVVRKLQVAPNEFQSEQARMAIEGCNQGLTAISSFLREHPRPPRPSCEPHHEFVRQEQKRLESQLAGGQALLRALVTIETDISNLGEARSLPELRTLAAAIQQRSQTLARTVTGGQAFEDRVNELVRVAIPVWLTTKGFPRKGPADRLAQLKGPPRDPHQEAVVTNQERLIGRFVAPRPGLTVWRYYPWNEPLVGPGETILPFREGDEPATPKYVQWAEYYNYTSEELSTRCATRGDWLDFLTHCETMEQQLQQYRTNSWAAEPEPDSWFEHWTFLPDQEVLPHRDLDDLSNQLAEVQAMFGR